MGVVADAWTWLTTGSNWSGESGAWHRLGEHVYVSGVALLLACAIALPVALWLGHIGRGGALAVNISNVGRAIPVFAVLALFMLTPLRSAGYAPTIIALVLFAVPPLLTNAYVGMREVDRAVVEAARGMGMSGGQLFLPGRTAPRLPAAHDRPAVGRRAGRRHRHHRLDGRPGRPRPHHHRRLQHLQHRRRWWPVRSSPPCWRCWWKGLLVAADRLLDPLPQVRVDRGAAVTAPPCRAGRARVTSVSHCEPWTENLMSKTSRIAGAVLAGGPGRFARRVRRRQPGEVGRRRLQDGRPVRARRARSSSAPPPSPSPRSLPSCMRRFSATPATGPRSPR